MFPEIMQDAHCLEVAQHADALLYQTCIEQKPVRLGMKEVFTVLDVVETL